jgi:hypothetical protein
MQEIFNISLPPMKSLPALYFLVALGFTLSSPANAAVIIGNLPQTNDANSDNITTGTDQAAFVFTVGPNAVDVTDVVLRLQGYRTTTGDVAEVGFFLDNGSGTNIGAQVGSFLTSPASSGNSSNNFTFTPATALTLTANTTYWLVVDSSASGSTFDWRSSNPSITPTGTGATAVAAKVSANNGTTYTNGSNYNSVQVNGTLVIVPEPSRAMLLLAGVITLGLRRRRQSAS